MDKTVHTVIDPERCLGCGLCIQVCPSETITMKDKKAVVTGDESLNCGHCQAVCPSQAVTVTSLPPGYPDYQTFKHAQRWMPHGWFDTGELVRLMRSRRSCRNYTPDPVKREMLEDLVKVGITAPSGTNSQKWTFTILPTREAVLDFANRIAEFFHKLNRAAEKAWLRRLLKLVGKPELELYYQEHYQSVCQALAEWKRTGRERLFHGATALIMVGSAPGASCPQEDALLATQNILLAAHAMGLGTCLVGFAVEAMTNDPGIKDFIGIPPEEKVHAVIALGHPNERYLGLAGRRPVTPRYFPGRRTAAGVGDSRVPRQP